MPDSETGGKGVHRMLRWVAVLALAALGLLYLNSAAHSWWSSWGPPTPDPQAWLTRAGRHLAIGIGCLLLSVLVFVAPRVRNRRVAKGM